MKFKDHFLLTAFEVAPFLVLVAVDDCLVLGEYRDELALVALACGFEAVVVAVFYYLSRVTGLDSPSEGDSVLIRDGLLSSATGLAFCSRSL